MPNKWPDFCYFYLTDAKYNVTWGSRECGSFERAVHLTLWAPRIRVVHLKEPFKRLALFYTVKVNGSLQRAVQSRSLQGAVQKSRLFHAEVCNHVIVLVPSLFKLWQNGITNIFGRSPYRSVLQPILSVLQQAVFPNKDPCWARLEFLIKAD